MRGTFLQCVAFTLLLALPARGQVGVPAAHRVAIGPFVGMNYTSFYGSDAEGVNSRWDFTAGGQLDVDFADVAFFRTGLLYAGRGAQTTESGVNVKVKLRYVELPLMLGYRFPTTGVRPYVAGGVHVAFKTACDFEGSSGGITESAACDDPNLGGGDFASTDFAILGGGGLLMPVGTGDLTLDARYALGLTKIEKSSDVKNRGFTVGVGFMIPIGR